MDPNTASSPPPPYAPTDKNSDAYPPYPPASGYPPPAAGYPPPGGMYPPPGQPMPQHGYPQPYPPGAGYSGYPPVGGGMPQPTTSQPSHHHGAATAQPRPVASTTVVIQSRGDCTKCYVGHIVETFTLGGVCCAIWCFPCGIFCCLTWRRRICSNCHAIYI